MKYKKNKKIRLVYILPNIFTATSLFCGLLSIIKSAQMSFEYASWLILISLILDGLDGRIARLTNSTSKFGLEYDSLADVIAFGVAPAMLIYFKYGVGHGKLGVIIPAIFAIFSATRLAKFNANDKSSINFIGLPTPTSAVFVATWVLMFIKYPILENKIVFLISIFIISVLMVSNIEYSSFKKINLQKVNIQIIIALLIVVLICIYVYPIEFLALSFTLYIIIGILYFPIKKTKNRSLNI